MANLWQKLTSHDGNGWWNLPQSGNRVRKQPTLPLGPPTPPATYLQARRPMLIPGLRRHWLLLGHWSLGQHSPVAGQKFPPAGQRQSLRTACRGFVAAAGWFSLESIGWPPRSRYGR